jgi:hypothetical protein
MLKLSTTFFGMHQRAVHNSDDLDQVVPTIPSSIETAPGVTLSNWHELNPNHPEHPTFNFIDITTRKFQNAINHFRA